MKKNNKVTFRGMYSFPAHNWCTHLYVALL